MFDFNDPNKIKGRKERKRQVSMLRDDYGNGIQNTSTIEYNRRGLV